MATTRRRMSTTMVRRSRAGPVVVALLLILSGAKSGRVLLAGDWPQWRGPARNGVSDDTGLLRSWSGDGPKLAWHASGLGTGYASVVVSDGLVFTIGSHEKDLFCFAHEAATGRRRWARKIGTTGRIPCSTPTVDGELLYALDPDGELICLTAASGEIVWRRSFIDDFGGRMMSGRGFGESPLVDGEKLICTPGGAEAMMVALHKRTGELLWKSKMPDIGPAGKDGAGFSSVVATDAAGMRQYVQLVGRGVIGVRASDGRFLWGYNPLANGTANIPTPVVRGDLVFAANGYNAGSVLLKLVPDGKGGVDAREVYALRGSRFQNHHGGMVLLGDFVYAGHGSNNGLPTCIELATGRVVWKRRGPGTGSAAVVYADGHLYFRYQDGVMALIQATAKGYRLKGTFPIPAAGGDSWAHPAIAGGRLYLREKDHLWVYDLKRGATSPPLAARSTPRPVSSGALAALGKLDVSVETLKSRSAQDGSSRDGNKQQRLYRYAVGGHVGTTAATQIVALTDKHVAPGGTLPADLLAQLRNLPNPLILDLAGTRVSDAGLRQTGGLANLVGLNLELCRRVTDAGMENLRQSQRLRVLLLTGTPITDEGLRHLVAVKSLLALDLEVCDHVTDAGCALLGSMTQLKALVVKKSGFEPIRITDAGLARLSTLSELEVLSLYGNQISDEGMIHLEPMRRLRSLDLSLLPITDRGLVHLKPLGELVRLELLFSEGFGGPMVTDAGLEALQGMARLKSLNLTGASITDAGVDRLARLKGIANLKLVNTKVTQEGARRLKVALPNCRIVR